MTQSYWIDRVRILNRRDCCGGRLGGTEVFVGGEKCGQVQGGTKNGQWYEVKCSKPLFGQKIKIVTTQKTYLSISGFEAYTGSAGGSTKTKVMPLRKTRDIVSSSSGSGSYNVPANTKVGFNNSSAKQSTNYGNNSYPATNAWSNGSKFTHTNKGVGQWWEVQMN